MADEREGAKGSTKDVASEDEIQTAGRKQNDAQPLNAANDEGGPERYPSVRQDDAVERTGRTEELTGEPEPRSFDPRADAPTPRQGAGDGSAAGGQQGFEGPAGDPAEGKR